jgi:hypothetical protein
MFALLEVSDLRYDCRGESVPQALAVSMIAFAIGRRTLTLTGRGQRMRASGPVERRVRRHFGGKRLAEENDALGLHETKRAVTMWLSSFPSFASDASSWQPRETAHSQIAATRLRATPWRR